MRLQRQQIILLGIFALFLAPLILVMLMRSSWWAYQPRHLSNRGQLITPPLHLTLVDHPDIAGKWLLLYLPPEPCQQSCTNAITALRQIHKASGRQKQQLAVVLLFAGEPDPALREQLLAIYPQLVFITDRPADSLALLTRIRPANTSGGGGLEDKIERFETFIIDPRQQVILAYNAENNPDDINTDLKRLLKWSKQDKMP